ncbi:hypothetical protein [Actinocorallia longicatena]|uniref:hypothetical protein n=1 Tax=Actinocorallia longicatena TaxID=111803 RepID=UPI0031E4230B
MIVILAASVSGCGAIAGMTGNKAEVCDQTRDAFTDFGKRLETLPPTDNAAWGKATTDFSAQLDALAAKADDGDLKKAITALAASWRTAGPQIAEKGDVTQMTALLREQPGKLGTACG